MNQLLKFTATILLTFFGVGLSVIVFAFAVFGLLFASLKEAFSYLSTRSANVDKPLIKRSKVKSHAIPSNSGLFSEIRISKTISDAQAA